MSKLVSFPMPFQTRRSLAVTDKRMFTWEGRYMLKLKIKLGSSFHFQMPSSMQLRRTICMLRFSDRDKIK